MRKNFRQIPLSATRFSENGKIAPVILSEMNGRHDNVKCGDTKEGLYPPIEKSLCRLKQYALYAN